MLPFLQSKKNVSVVTSLPAPKDSSTEVPPTHDPLLMYAVENLIKALEQKDAQSVASAIKAIFLVCDREPHVEGPHE